MTTIMDTIPRLKISLPAFELAKIFSSSGTYSCGDKFLFSELEDIFMYLAIDDPFGESGTNPEQIIKILQGAKRFRSFDDLISSFRTSLSDFDENNPNDSHRNEMMDTIKESDEMILSIIPLNGGESYVVLYKPR